MHAFEVAHAVRLVRAERHDDEVGLRGGDALAVTIGEEAFAGGAVAANGGKDEAVGAFVGHHLRLTERRAQRLLHGIGKRLACHVRVAEMQHAQRPFATQHDVERGAQGGGICNGVLLAVSERCRHAACRLKREAAQRRQCGVGVGGLRHGRAAVGIQTMGQNVLSRAAEAEHQGAPQGRASFAEAIPRHKPCVFCIARNRA